MIAAGTIANELCVLCEANHVGEKCSRCHKGICSTCVKNLRKDICPWCRLDKWRVPVDCIVSGSVSGTNTVDIEAQIESIRITNSRVYIGNTDDRPTFYDRLDKFVKDSLVIGLAGLIATFIGFIIMLVQGLLPMIENAQGHGIILIIMMMLFTGLVCMLFTFLACAPCFICLDRAN